VRKVEHNDMVLTSIVQNKENIPVISDPKEEKPLNETLKLDTEILEQELCGTLNDFTDDNIFNLSIIDEEVTVLKIELNRCLQDKARLEELVE